MSVSSIRNLAEHAVSVGFVDFANTKIELLHPLGEKSSVSVFLHKNPSGGTHHLCFEVNYLIIARDKLIKAGYRILGDGKPKVGAHGKPVLFIHPKDFDGTLIEIEEL